MKILILGGTGPMGVYLTDFLRERASELVVTSRTARESVGNLRFVQGNAKDMQCLHPLLNQSWDAIIDFMVYSTQEFRDRVDLFLSATAQYFFLSSARVYAQSDEPLTEASPRLLDVSTDKEYLTTDEYALAKARQENFLFEHTEKNWTIIRPYITYGPERLQLGVFEKEAWLYRALRGRSIVFCEEIAKRKTTMTHGRDVAQSMASLIGESSALGEAFHITEPHSQNWQSILDLYLAKLRTCEHTPSVEIVDLNTFISCHGGRYQVIYDRLYDRVFSNSKIGQYIDTNNFITANHGLDDCLEIFQKKPRFSKINWGLEGTKDRLTKDFVRINEIKKPVSWLKYLRKRMGI